MWLNNSKWTVSFSNSVMTSNAFSYRSPNCLKKSLLIVFRLLCLSKKRKPLFFPLNYSLPHPLLCQSETISPKGSSPVTC